MMSSYDVIPYVMIRELGLADQYHLDLRLEVFTSAKERDAAFLAGELDGGFKPIILVYAFIRMLILM